MPLITATEFKTSTGRTEADAVVTEAIAIAQGLMEQYCGRLFDYAAGVVEVIDGDGGDMIQVRRYPITTLTKIELRSGKSSWSTVGASSYADPSSDDPNRNNGQIYLLGSEVGTRTVDIEGFAEQSGWGRSTRWPEGRRNIRVTYSGGFDGGSSGVDEDTYLPGLRGALNEVVSTILSRRGGRADVTGENLGSYSYTLGELLSPEQIGIVHAFRRGDTL